MFYILIPPYRGSIQCKVDTSIETERLIKKKG